MVDSPLALAQSQSRIITVPKGPEDRLKEAFVQEWEALGADRLIMNTARLARIYGIASIALLEEGIRPNEALNFNGLYSANIAFNCFDPLNTAGSLVLNQRPNAFDFQKNIAPIRVESQEYHRSRSIVLQNEDPLYIEYTVSAFGFTGRSVYQRALFMLKSFIQTLIADDMVALKAGVLVAKQKAPGSIVDQIMAAVAGVKRQIVKEAVTTNVISIDLDEEIETLNFQNLDGPFRLVRKNILDNIATAADMPAIFLNQETFAEGFGEGTEDAKRVSQYISRVREWMNPLYCWFDRITMARAWSPDFFATIQKDFPGQYASMTYEEAFYDWANSFQAIWPNLIEEPDSEKIKVDEVKLKATIAGVEVFLPVLDPENRSILIQWAADCFNSNKLLFSSPLNLDYEALKDYVPPVEEAAKAEAEAHRLEPPPKPFSASDSIRVHNALDALSDAVSRLPERVVRPRLVKSE
jgi:hypothetical protein